MSEPEELALAAMEAVLAAPAERLLDALDQGGEDETALRRQQLEALAALALALPVAVPPAALRQRLLASLAGDETQQVPRLQLGPAGPPDALDPAAPPAALPAGPPRQGPVAPGHAAPPAAASPGAAPPAEAAPTVAVPAEAAPAVALPAALPATPAPRRAPPATLPRRRSRGAWALALAAGLAAVALGTASALLWRELEATRGLLARSERARAELATKLAAAEVRQESGAERAAELGALREQLALVTAAGTELCALQPPAARPVAPGAKGLLWVAADHQHWYLRADGLTPPGPGRVYRLWFLAGGRPVDAGAFRLEGDQAVLTSPTMPAGTTAAMVTVEAEGAPRERPSGPVVLYGRDFVKR